MIKHVFVVMLENRSFDHMLGLSNITGTDAVTGKPTAIDGLNDTNNSNPDLHSKKVFVSTPADWTMQHDPGHNFADVREQLCGRGGNYPESAHSGIICEGDVVAGKVPAGVSVTAPAPASPEHMAAPVDTSLRGFVHIAFLRDMHISAPEEKEQQTAKYLSISTNADAQQYMAEVRQKINAYKATMGAKE